MLIIKNNLKQKEITIKIINQEDLWYLHKIIDENDIVQGKTTRKIKLEQKTDRKTQVIKKTVFLKIQVEKQEFHEFSNNLRVSGKTIEPIDDIKRGAYHTFDLEPNQIITIIKPNWLQYHLKILDDSVKDQTPKTLICILDRSESCFALLKSRDFEILSEIKGEVNKKQYQENIKSNFYKDVSKQLQEYFRKYKIQNIILGSPSFWKEYLLKEIPKDMHGKIIQATCNHVGEQGINELLKRTELRKILSDERTAQELNLVEELLKNISKNKSAVYGFNEVRNAAESSSIKDLLITDKFIKKMRQDNNSKELEYIFNLTESSKGQIHIISSKNQAGQRLDNLSGIAGILRY